MFIMHVAGRGGGGAVTSSASHLHVITINATGPLFPIVIISEAWTHLLTVLTLHR